MTRSFPRKYLAAPAAALGAAALAVTVLAQPAPATTVIVDDGHWDLVAEVDCATNAVEPVKLLTENHDTATTQALADTVFEVNSANADVQVAADKNRFDPDPLRALSHDEAEVSIGRMVLGFEVEYATSCGSSTPDVAFVVDSSVVNGKRAAAYKNTTGTGTDLDTANGSGLNVGVVTDTHEDRRWGFSAAGTYEIDVAAEVTLGGQLRDIVETVEFDVKS